MVPTHKPIPSNAHVVKLLSIIIPSAGIPFSIGLWSLIYFISREVALRTDGSPQNVAARLRAAVKHDVNLDRGTFILERYTARVALVILGRMAEDGRSPVLLEDPRDRERIRELEHNPFNNIWTDEV